MNFFKKDLLLIVLLSIFSSISWAQNGTVKGSIIDIETGEAAIGVTVQIANSNIGSISDIDGHFELSVPAGKHKIIISSIFSDTVIMDNVVVVSNQTTQIPLVKLGEVVTEFSEVVIQGSRKTDTDVSILALKQKAPNTIDGISSASIRKSGDSDVASAMARVPGVSVSNGKYAYVRGIGDRYNKTLLNGMEIPGLDPDRNSIQMDIFPTAIIDNLLVNKTFIAELPADFAGGVIDINLKSFPDQRKSNFTLSMGFNPNYHFNKNYLTQVGGKTDFLGFDDGTRKIPAESNIPFYAKIIGNPNGPDATRYKEILKKFNPNMAAIQQMSMMDAGFNISHGDQKKLSYSILGYQMLINYSNSTEFYQDAEFGRYGLKSDPSVFQMEMREFQKGSYGVNNVMLNAMGGVGLKTLKSKYTLSLIHLQNGETKSGIFDYEANDQGSNFTAVQHNLEYNQRGMTNLQLIGNHNLGTKDKWIVDWKGSTSISSIQDPDVRFTRYRTQVSGFSIGTESGFPERIWRKLKEINVNAKLDATWKFYAFKQEGMLKFGAGHIFKKRDFDIKTFMVNVRNIELTGNPDELFSPENLWPYNGQISQGTTIEPTFLPINPNLYSSNANNTFAYVSALISPVKFIKAVIGLRSELYQQKYSGRDQMGYNILNNDKVLSSLDLFPSMNLTFVVSKKQNIRLAYGKTTARPTFKELSYAEIVDPLTGRTFIGGMFKDVDKGSGIVYWDGNLKSTGIHNIDLRWEFFPTPNQTISVSAFYKKFFNPIEIVQFASQAGSFQPRNVGDGQVIGAEVEFRFGLGFISDKLTNFSVVSNFTYTDSRIAYSETEKISRINNARDGESIKNYRKMAGQAPYVVNAGILYNGGEKRFLKSFEVGVFYNMQGPTLIYVGMVDRPDVYSVPFHSLNFNASKKFGKKDQWSIALKISNLLNDKKEEVYQSFNAEKMNFSNLSIGTTSTLKVGYNF